jgi:hypothetical protein
VNLNKKANYKELGWIVQALFLLSC